MGAIDKQEIATILGLSIKPMFGSGPVLGARYRLLTEVRDILRQYLPLHASCSAWGVDGGPAAGNRGSLAFVTTFCWRLRLVRARAQTCPGCHAAVRNRMCFQCGISLTNPASIISPTGEEAILAPVVPLTSFGGACALLPSCVYLLEVYVSA